MIAAGSLFTSCIEQVEPLGIQDMRLAKAEYIRALKDLRAADAEYRRAEAAVQQAIARYEDALTAKVNAETEYQKLLNEYQALLNEARSDTNEFNRIKIQNEIDKIQKEMEVRVLEHQRNLAKAEKEMRLAKEDLRVTIRNINLACGDLTANEKVAIYEAAAVYYYLLEENIAQDTAVSKAQLEVLKAKETAARFADTAWNHDSMQLMNVLDDIEAQIEKKEAQIAFWMDKYENMPDTAASIAEWKEYYDSYTDIINELDAKLADIAYERVIDENMTKEGVRTINQKVAEFVEKYWPEDPAGTFTEPTDLTKEEKAFLAAGEPKAEDYLVLADTIAFPVLKSNPSWTFNKFQNLLIDYFVTYPTPGSLDYDVNVIAWDSDVNGYVLKANQGMKAFVMGTDQSTVDSQKYTFRDTAKTDDFDPDMKWDAEFSYGLNGAISVLERKMVAEKANPKSYQDSVDKYQKIWKQDGDSLKAVLTRYATWKKIKTADQKKANGNVEHKKDHGYLYDSYAPYKAAIDALKAANDAYDKADSTIKANRASLFEAIAKLYDELLQIDGDKEINKADSVAIMNAIEKFAAAREKYLEDKNKYPKQANPHYFYFATKKELGEPVVDSVKLSEIASQTKFPAVAYEYALNAELTPMTNVVDAEKGRRRAIANVLNQMFGIDKTAFDKDASTAMPLNIPTALAASTPVLSGSTDVYKVDSWENPTTITRNGNAYAPTASKATVDAKKLLVDESITKYEDLYKKYWGASAYKDPEAQYDPKGYDPESFTKPFPIVNFDEYDYMEYWTPGLVTVVEGVGMNADDPYQFEDFFGKNYDADPYTMDNPLHSDFYRYMYWVDKIGTIDENVLEELKKWVAAVEAAFVADLEPDPDKLAAAKELFDELTAEAAAYDKYMEVLTAFVGTRVVDVDTVVNDVNAYINNATDGVFVKGTDSFDAITTVSDLFATNLLDNYVSWRADLGGELLNVAETAFGKEPFKDAQKLNDTEDQLKEQKKAAKTLQKKLNDVLMAAAKLDGLRDENTSGAATTIKDVDALYKAYVATYNNLRKEIVVFDDYDEIDREDNTGTVNKLVNEIDDLKHQAAIYRSEQPDLDLLVKLAEDKLAIELNRQKQLNQALTLAKENYDRIREYLMSQDGVSYIIPISTADVDDVIMNLNYIVKQFGLTIAEVVALVADDIAAE